MISARKIDSLFMLIVLFLYIFNSYKGSLGLHTVSSGRYSEGNQTSVSGQLIYGNQVLAAKGGQFELGFFSPRNSTNFYVGVWCKNISVLVVNRDTPIQRFSNNSRLNLAEDGTLILLDNMKEKTLAVHNSAGLSPDLNNKGVKHENKKFTFSYGLSVVWQSFAYPTDTGKLKMDENVINNRQILTSWENPNDPGAGKFSIGMVTRASPEFLMWNNRSQVLWRSGAWNRHCFASFSSIITNTSHNLIAQTKYFTYVVKENITSRLILTNITEFSRGSLPQSSEILPSGFPEYEKQSFVLVALSSVTITLVICIFLICLVCYIRRKINSKKGVVETNETNENLLLLNLEDSSKQYIDNNSTTTGNTLEEEKKVSNLPYFSFSSICAATNNFSSENKLGQGGFGPVFKGNLFNGHSVAVKRLSQMSGQGVEELRNETVLIAKLQHRNLVRLLGCCIEQDEKILIYEYMPNKSLDLFNFDPSKQYLLDWKRRVKIIEGIAQGLVYLHQHSRLCIIHRDLKASNILLDGEMNPKISDFGMARIIGGEEQQANTTRIVGTYGYMSPEYAMEGSFSIKSDVYSFGVLLLEILSGKKNTGFRHSDCLSLLGHAWELWKTEKVLELICSNLVLPSLCVPMRFIHIGLLPTNHV